MSTITNQAKMMFEDVTKDLSDEQILKDQQEFAQFLKDQGWYHQFLSADDMRKWHSIWKRTNPQNNIENIPNDIIEFLQVLAHRTDTQPCQIPSNAGMTIENIAWRIIQKYNIPLINPNQS